MKKLSLSFYFLFLFIVYAKAQTAHGVITGKIIDADTKIPVDYATISLYKQDSASPFNGINSDDKGNFVLKGLPDGDYKIYVDFIGYQRNIIGHVIISKNHSEVVLNSIFLKAASNLLKDVVITAKVPVVENKIDRIVYNTANDLTAQGGVAIDVLKKVPMISVDIDGNVELQGNSNIRFLINGKPSSIFGSNLTDALQAIPASQIKSIEVITNPGAKYDATGTGGIINIILKDSNIQGINGNVNLSAGSRLENGSFNLNARKGKFGAGVFFSGNEQLNTVTNSTSNRQSYNNTRDTVTNLMQNRRNMGKNNGYQTGFHFQWDITRKDNLTGSIGFNHFDSHNNGFSYQQQDELNTAGNVLSDIISDRTSNNISNNTATDWSLNYKKTFNKEGQELDVSYNSSLSKNSSNFSQLQDYLAGGYPTSGTQGYNPGRDHETDISADYTQPVSKSVTIETGVKAVIENLSNNVNTDTLLNDGSYVPDHDQTYGFNYRRDIYAAYLSSTFSMFNSFINGKAGLRYESTSTNSDEGQIPGYNTFAPSFVLMHKLNETEAIKLSYSYRIQRPSYGDLNPFYNISDPHNISTGNPNLRAEGSHNYEAGYNKSFDDGANLFVSAFYRHSTNDLQSLTTYYEVLDINGVDYSDVSLTERYNIGTETSEGVNFFGSLPLIEKKLNLRTNIMLAGRSDSNPGLPTVNGFNYHGNLNISYDFGHNLVAETFGNYNSSQKNIQGQRPAFAFYNIAVRKQFLNKKLSIGITTADPFTEYIAQKSTTYGSNFDQTNVREVPYRSVSLSLNYRFGKLEFKKDEDKDEDKDKEDQATKRVEN
jgi:ferric enterobactin receptor